MDAKKYLDHAMEITGQFEGRGFDQVTGNFDNMGLSVGFLQWNYGMGSLQSKILKPYISKYGASKMDAFFPVPVSPTANYSPTQAVTFCKNNMLSGTSVKSNWKSAWEKFLASSETVSLQKDACVGVAEQAANYCTQWGMETERTFCFMFDVVTQNGSLKTVKKPTVTDALVKRAINYSKKNATLWGKQNLDSEQKVLLIAAMLRAELANSQWRQDVMDRKGTIACGVGTVHGSMRTFVFGRPTEAPVTVKPPVEIETEAKTGVLEQILSMLYALWEKVFGSKPKEIDPITGEVDPLADMVKKITEKNKLIKEVALRRALAFKDNAKVKKKNLIALVDFTINDAYPRYFLIDMKTFDSKSFKVSHGSKSDLNKDGFVDDGGFSNVEGSNKSSIGAMVYAEMYKSSKFKIACRIDGLEPALNGLVRKRAIVGHDSNYVNDTIGKAIGDSLGCFAHSYTSAKEILPQVTGGVLLYAWDDSLEG